MTGGASAAGSRRPPLWVLPVLLAAGAWVVLDDLWDAGVVKTAVVALLAAVLLLPALAIAGREAVGGWFGSLGGRLSLLSTACALPMALPALHHAAVTDRLLGFGLAHVAAMAGVLVARHAPRRVGRSLGWVVALPALVCVAQALGWERSLTPGPEEIVGLSGNSIRAGALCALGLVALAAQLLARDARSLALPLGASLVTLALLLTRARGARWTALVVLALLVVVAWRRQSGGARAGALKLVLALLTGLAAGAALGGADTLAGRKLDDQASVFSGHDPTTEVRLALARTSLEMLADRPLAGVGLGRFRQFAPPYRDPAEADLPGLAGAPTEAEHPHDELLLAFVEGGLPGGLLLLALLGLSLARAWRGRHDDGGLATLGLLVAGVLLGLGQDAWTDPGTALPFFAALGFVWGRPESGDRATPMWIGAPLLLFGAGLAVLAWPRLDAHMSWRSFYQRADRDGFIAPETMAVLVHAADTAPTDGAIQLYFLDIATHVYLPRVIDDGARDQIEIAIGSARDRLAALAPPPRPD